ncbi:hypothetical protein ACLOJK_011993 [Asimina triloba]
MVLGLRSKNKKSNVVHVEYIIHVLEIKPWPPSQSLKSLRSVGLYWENGEKNSGSLNPVAPTLGNGAGEGKIEFNESFRLKVTLLGEASTRGGNANFFQKNCLELNLFEPRRDRSVKSQLLGNIVIDLAEYGIIKESVVVSSPMNCKRSFWNTSQPVMFIKIQHFDKDGSTSSSYESIRKEASLDKDSRESVSALMNGEYAEEEEIASFTDDDVSSHSSLTVSSYVPEQKTDLAPQNGTSVVRTLQEENKSGAVKESLGKDSEVPGSLSVSVLAKLMGPSSATNPSNATFPQQGGHSSPSSSIDLSSGSISPESGNDSISNVTERILATDARNSSSNSFQSFSSSTEDEFISNNSTRSMGNNNSSVVHEKVVVDRGKMKYNNGMKEGDTAVESSNIYLEVQEKATLPSTALCETHEDKESGSTPTDVNSSDEASDSNGIHEMLERKDDDMPVENGQMEEIKSYSNSTQNEDRKNHPTENSFDSSAASMIEMGDDLKHGVSQDAVRKSVLSSGEQLAFSMRSLGGKGSSFTSDRLNHTKFPARLPLDISGAIPSVACNETVEEVKEVDISCHARNGPRGIIKNSGKDVRGSRSMSANRVNHLYRDVKNSFSDSKARELESRVEILEAELREAALVELGLYSIVAEHGSSASKVHAPARRLSRLYIHALRRWPVERRAGIARSAVSGLVLVAKACGNDVPRLTFWLSNSVVLRAIITETTGEKQVVSARPHVEINSVEKRSERKSSILKQESSFGKKEISFSSDLKDWEDPQTFTAALEKIEAWIFSRIIESVWWQTLTPHMQSSPEGSRLKTCSNSKKSYGRISSLNDQEQCDFSVNHWEKAFKDAYERICPVRAGGHECGCLPILARLVMEQCVARLDVAMFNAILRESDEEIPTDPISDPISDPKVLPIPAGKSSFGSGAQLKNAIGSWSRWLTGLFGIDSDDSLEDATENSTKRKDNAGKFKAFYLLNALSDLLMLPKDMLLDKSIRKEVCPTFGAPLIKRVLNSFVPDEFCPDSVPKTFLEALESEVSLLRQLYEFSPLFFCLFILSASFHGGMLDSWPNIVVSILILLFSLNVQSQDPLESNEGTVTSFPCNASLICYSPPSAASVSSIIGDLKSQSQLRRSGSSVLRKCHTSDDELDELDSPLTSIVINSSLASPTTLTPAEWKLKQNSSGNTLRFQLLREVWGAAD